MENQEEKYNRYAAMMRRHLETVRRACAYWSHGDDEAWSVLLHEVQTALWLRIDSLKPDTTVLQERLWVIWQVRSVAWNMRRSRRRHSYVALDPSVDGLAAPDDSANDEMLDLLAECLDDAEREMLALIRQGFSMAEIAVRQHTTLEAARSRRRRMVDKMRRRAQELDLM